MDRLAQDLRYAVRMLLKNPGLTAAAVLTLALGIGANTAIFSVVDAVLLRPLPFREPGRLVAVWERNYKRDRARNVANPGNYVRWAERNQVFESMAAFAPWTATLSGEGEAVRLPIGAVTPNFFATLGVEAARGRSFQPADGAPGAPDVVVISEALWQRRYAGDPGAVGRNLVVNGRPAAIVGVMPAELDVPPGVQLWLPLTIDQRFREAGGRWLSSVARLKPGVSVEQAKAAMDVLAAALEAERAEVDAGWGVTVTPLHRDLVSGVRPMLLALVAGVVLLLLIACVNVAGLLLSRAMGRAREIAIRVAMGAGRGRIVRQLLTESLLLSLAGGAAGLLVGWWTIGVLVAVLPAEIPAFMAIRLSPAVLGFTLLVCVAASVLTGLTPALRLSDPSLVPALKEGGAARGVGWERRRIGRLLVASEVALALALLTGAGLLARSYVRLLRVDPGFDAQNVLNVEVSLPSEGYREPARQARFFQQAVDALAALPGVRAAAAVSWRPLGAGSATSFEVPDRPRPPLGEEPVADVRMVTPGLFHSLGIALREGRDFSADDGPERPSVVVVNERLAQDFWPGESAVGKRVRMEWNALLDAEIVGVVADVRLASLDTRARATLYWPQAQLPNSFMSLVVKTQGTPAALSAAARSAIAGLDKSVAADIKPLEQVVSDSLGRQSFTAVFAGAFAFTAILLAAVGLFGVIAQSVGERRTEFALRMALGARRQDIVSLVLREGLWLTAAGGGCGIAGALVAGRALATLLYEISPADPATLAAVLLFLVAVALVAILPPAWRAARVDPMAMLRYE